MHIRYGYAIEIVCDQPTPLITMLDVHPERRGDLIEADDMVATSLLTGEPLDTSEVYLDQFSNICRRVVAPAGGVRLEALGAIHDSGLPDPQVHGAAVAPPDKLPAETLIYLLGSRYCETDRLSSQAWSMFGHIEGGWEKVQAVCDFVHDHLRFNYQFARNTRTALEAFEERVGVCRDFTHLAVALCRSLNIPARYCTGYLGDIGVPADPNPMDFSAWFEAYLDGGWRTFDARHNIPRIGRIVMARGRDATDVPIVNSFGPHYLRRFEVITEEITEKRHAPAPAQRREHFLAHAFTRAAATA